MVLFRFKALFAKKGVNMGKDLKGKEIGEGIYQLPSKKYHARVYCLGKRIGQTFDTVQEARIWVAERQMASAEKKFFPSMSLNEWYGYWIEEIKRPAVKYGTYETYRDIYTNRIKPKLGNMKLDEIKPIDCQVILNQELKHHKKSTVKHTLICMQQIFNSAVDNELLEHSPVRKIKVGNEKNERRVFTAKEQQDFIEHINKHRFKYRDECMFILETGLRIGELLGLKWSDVQDNKIVISRSMFFVRKEHRYIETTPKTKAGNRTIPLTSKAYAILKGRKVTRMDYIFFNPERTTRYNMTKSLWNVCNSMEIERISAHGLRHTFATRCIEAGMKPKTLQKILGHSTLSMTMDLYVHVTDETLEKEMQKFDRWVTYGS